MAANFDRSSRYRGMTTRLRPHKSGGLVEAVGHRMTRLRVGNTSAYLPKDFEELDRISYSLYKTPLQWWAIADQNDHLAWPLDLPKGEPVVVPSGTAIADR